MLLLANFLYTISSGAYSLAKIAQFLNELLLSSGFILCPGIPAYPDILRFKTKNLIESGPLFNRKYSTACLLWHAPVNFQLSSTHALFNTVKPTIH